MKTPKERLMNDVLADDDYAAFRRDLYFQGLVHLRRRRWERQRRRLQALAACALITIGMLFYLSGSRPLSPRLAIAGDGIVHSAPLRADQLVAATGSGLEVFRTQPGELTAARERFPHELVRTELEPTGLEFITDDQLAALFPGQPLALIPAGDGRKQLCFLDPKARELFLDGEGVDGR